MSKKSKKKELEKKAKKASKQSKKEKKAKKAKATATQLVSPEQRLEMIATAAYYIAERHGFTAGESSADWRAAEKEIDAVLKKQRKKKTKD